MNAVFYELKHEIGADYFTLEENRDFSFPMHMHRCYEIILMLEGSMKVRIEKEEYRIGAGDMIFVKPNHIHSLETDESSHHLLCIFSPELIAALSEPLIRYRLPSPVLRQIAPIYRELFCDVREDGNIGRIKGFLYLIAGLFYDQLDFSEEDPAARGKHLLRDIFRYVDENISCSCSILDLAEELNYSPSYLSRFFYTNVGMPYSVYVQNIKISHACYLLRNTDGGIAQIAQQCGYISSSSFNRNFKQLTGCSPTEYKKRNAKSKYPPL